MAQGQCQKSIKLQIILTEKLHKKRNILRFLKHSVTTLNNKHKYKKNLKKSFKNYKT